jgi:hypothetical protein
VPLQLSRVHVTEKIQGTHNETRVVRTNHYIRLADGNHPPLYIQGGQVFSEGGPLVAEEELPDWFWLAAQKCSPDALAAVGFRVPDERWVGQKLAPSEEDPLLVGSDPTDKGRRRR